MCRPTAAVKDVRADPHSQVQVSKRAGGRSRTVPHHHEPRDPTMSKRTEVLTHGVKEQGIRTDQRPKADRCGGSKKIIFFYALNNVNVLILNRNWWIECVSLCSSYLMIWKDEVIIHLFCKWSVLIKTNAEMNEPCWKSNDIGNFQKHSVKIYIQRDIYSTFSIN